MIKLENLTKVYESKYKSVCKALDNVSFSLPDKGMVFVCGKSGSGKSTMINLLAGLDEITSGDIIIDGNKLSSFTNEQFNEYRNSYIGFVFQDFCLIDSFTVKENIMLALNLKGEEDSELVNDILLKVGLEEYGSRFPKELSGGQKQRVSIARALVKNPKCILADEPTGNLDSETSIQILELLKQLSKDKLVLIISHSMDNAYEYGDRIIELADGRIIGDISKDNSNYKLIENNTIYLPINKKLNFEELSLVNEKISSGKYTISQEDRMFVKTIQPVDDNQLSFEKNKGLSLFNMINISRKFSKNTRLNLFLSSIMIGLLVIIMITTQVFTGFNGKNLLDQALDPSDVFVLNKGYIGNKTLNTLSRDLLVNITDEEIDSFYEKGYAGNIYKLYSFNVPPHMSSVDNHALPYGKCIDYSNLSSFYIEVGRGVLECSEEYIRKLYNLETLEYDGTLKDTGKSELVITDYFADCLLLYRGYKDYQEILDTEKIEMSLSSFNVKAIIKTNYKKKYQSIIDTYDKIEKTNSLIERNKLIEDLQESDLFLEFYNDLLNKYSVCYYIDGSFFQRLKEDKTNSKSCWFDLATFESTDGIVKVTGGTHGKVLDESLKPGEIKIATSLFQTIYGIEPSKVTSEMLSNIEIKINEYYKYDRTFENLIYGKTYKLVGFVNSTQPLYYYSQEDYYDSYQLQVFPYALYFDDVESISNIYNPIENQTMYSTDKYIDGIYSIMNIVLIFNDFFKLITIAIAFVCVGLLVSYGRRSIKRRMFEIGVIRALGGKNRQLYGVFLFQILYLLFFVSIISSITLIFLDDVINNILLENIMLFLNNTYIRDLSIISFNPILIIVNLVVLSLLTILSSSSLLLILRKIKPINIIRKKED